MPRGTVVSLQVGTPGTLPWRGQQVRSAIFKDPVAGPVTFEHRADWEALVGQPLPHDAFGENPTTSGLLEAEVHVGDLFEVGTARVQVSQPRAPCLKLGARWGRRSLPARMATEGRSGWYLRVLHHGVVEAGDELSLAERTSEVSIGEVIRVTYAERDDAAGRARVVAVPELAEDWRAVLSARRGASPLVG